jgi:hypothetical protein
MRSLTIIILIAFTSQILSCKSHNRDTALQEGDLLFQNLNCGPLCDAIEAVTEGAAGKDYSHIGLVVKINDSLRILEAIGHEVQTTPLQKFFARSGDTVKVVNITAARLKKEYRSLIPEAVAFSTSRIGQPYDDDYLMNNGKWYCSELLYEAFKNANKGQDLFVLQPMTFKDPKTGNYFPAWVDYYKNLGIDIPEGKPGINPGLMSRSGCLQIISLDSFPQ